MGSYRIKIARRWGTEDFVLAVTWDLHEWSGRVIDCLFPPAAWTSPSPHRISQLGGAVVFLPSTLNLKGLKVGRARVQRGWGVGFLLCPCPSPPHLCLPVLIYPLPPLETEDFYFLLFITLGPLFFLPINLSHLHKTNRHAPQGWLDKDFYFFIT